MYQTFNPGGPTVLVDTTARQVLTGNASAVSATSYRIVNLGTAYAYIAWGIGKVGDTVAPSVTSAAPTAGNPATNTLGIPAGGVETFSLPPNAWFKASAGASFEVTPGEGL